MPGSTSRLTLVEPLGTDAVTELRLAIAANAVSLDKAAMWSSGVFSSRPSASSTPLGTLYYATDSTVLYLNQTGTAWSVVPSGVDTGWLNTTISVGAASNVTPQARQIGSQVFVRGAWVFTGSTPSTGTTIGVLHSGIAHPAVTNASFGANIEGPTGSGDAGTGGGYIQGGNIVLNASSYDGASSTSYFVINDFSYVVS